MTGSHSAASAQSAAQERHPHLGHELEEGWVRVDCHSHSMWSGDCTTTPDELAAAIEASRIDVLCITDHNVIAGASQLASELPCRVIIGEEMRVGGGELIGLFLSERVPQGLGPLESARRIRDQGGIVYIPHPFDPMRNCLRPEEIDLLVGEGLVDAIEGKNAKTSLASLNQKAVDYGHQHGLMVGAGSDAHVPEAIGAVYLVMPDFDGPASFLGSMAQGRIVGHHFDEPRRWTPRIVPSVDDPIAT
ncbi:MAG: PHP domain-containing protein [Actinomycetia bacterium]|nr:PHP domain-containing protein [Actinomycetes bacterium]MCP4221858.1 PHP domain-containing protein [Actinomycetes bacterium]MCP5031742.1 PHP domain-containing protein [Actinomycetes bacterium]